RHTRFSRDWSSDVCSSDLGYVSTLPQSFPEKAHYDAGGSKYVEMPMNLALAKSINNAALYIIKQVGVHAFVDFAQRCGIKSKLRSEERRVGTEWSARISEV